MSRIFCQHKLEIAVAVLILVIGLLMASMARAEDVCFTGETAGKIIVEIEQCRIEQEEIILLNEAVTNLEARGKEQDGIIEALRDEVNADREALGEYQRLIENQGKLYEAEIKKVKLGFFQQVLEGLGFIGAGILIGVLL